jgi:hypothetical protein
MNIKSNITGAATGVLIGVGKDALAAVAPELYPAFAEWIDQRKTPDGWTEIEYLTYADGAIGRVKAKVVGPGWADHVFDWGLQALQMMCRKRIDEILAITDPTNPHPAPLPPATKPYYGKLFTERPDAATYDVDGDLCWWNQATNPIAIVFTITDARAVMAYRGWARTTWG